MNLHKAEVGERYSDDSGWKRRVMIDLQSGKLEIELNGYDLSTHPRELTWLISALEKVRDLVCIG